MQISFNNVFVNLSTKILSIKNTEKRIGLHIAFVSRHVYCGRCMKETNKIEGTNTMPAS